MRKSFRINPTTVSETLVEIFRRFKRDTGCDCIIILVEALLGALTFERQKVAIGINVSIVRAIKNVSRHCELSFLHIYIFPPTFYFISFIRV